MSFIKKELEDYKLLLRSVPSLVITVFVVSVILMNLLANKELFSAKYLALDCGFALSWVSFLCMDMICKHFGPRASAKISILAVFINLCACLIFKFSSMTSGMWGEFYSTGLNEVNDALNATFGGSWYVVAGSSIAMIGASITNSLINMMVAKRVKARGFSEFAARSYISTLAAQLVDNLLFATLVSHVFFGWTWIQVVTCSITGALMELLCEVVLSPVGYRVVLSWEADQVGKSYNEYRNA